MRRAITVGLIFLLVLSFVGIYFWGKKRHKDREPENVAVVVSKMPVKEVSLRPSSERLEQYAESSDAVRCVMGLDTNNEYLLRFDAAKSLGNNLTQAEINALFDFLSEYYSDQADLDIVSFNAIKTEVVNAMLRQKPIPDKLVLRLIEMYRADSHDYLWRDYCIQFMAPLYQAKWETADAAAKDPESALIEGLLWEAVEKGTNYTVGTALLGLERLSQQYSGISRVRVGDSAVAIASDKSRGSDQKIAAMQVCGLTGKSEVLPTLRLFAQTGETVPLRLAAIHVLGQLGGKEDLQLLKSLESDADSYARKAAAQSHQHLQKRLDAKG